MIDFSDLETDLDSIETVGDEPAPREIAAKLKTDINPETTVATEFKCGKCNGTGVFTYGYRTVRRGKCHSCNGRGFFKTNPADRAEARAKRAIKKEADAQSNAADWATDHPALSAYLQEVKSWNGFAGSLLQGIEKHGDLTSAQASALNRMKFKHDTKQAQKSAADERRVHIDLTAIHALFKTASESGLKRPRLTIGDINLAPAKSTSPNAGCLYVKLNGDYCGKVTEAGKFFPNNRGANVEAKLLELAVAPLEQLKLHGQQTGSCSCCNRELTDPKSVALGIGPVCAGRWGLL